MSKVRAPIPLVHAIAVGKVQAFYNTLQAHLAEIPSDERQPLLDHLLHLAASFAPPRKVSLFRPGSVAIAELLLSQGANVNALDHNGNTPSTLAFCAYKFGDDFRTPPTRALLRVFARYNADFTLGPPNQNALTLAYERGLSSFMEGLELEKSANSMRSQTVISPISLRTFL